MKKLFILLTLCIGIGVSAFAQDSTGIFNMFSVQGPTNSIHVTAASEPGLTPSDTFLPCVVRGSLISDTITFTNYTMVNYQGAMVTMNSLTIDSIYLPSGATWSTNSATNTFAGGAAGAIYVTGTTNDSAGQYKLRIIVSATLESIITLPNINAEQYTGLAYRVRVINSGCGCPYINNGHADSTWTFVPFDTCAAVGCPTITVNTSEVNSTSGYASASGGVAPYTYRWSNSQNTDTATGLTVNTAYTVTATDHNGCTGTGTFTPLGIESIGDITSFSIYPNPSNGVFTASIHLATSSFVTISISDVTGNKIYESTDNAVNDLNKQINLSTVSAGIYFINVRTADGTANQRIVIR